MFGKDSSSAFGSAPIPFKLSGNGAGFSNLDTSVNEFGTRKSFTFGRTDTRQVNFAESKEDLQNNNGPKKAVQEVESKVNANVESKANLPNVESKANPSAEYTLVPFAPKPIFRCRYVNCRKSFGSQNGEENHVVNIHGNQFRCQRPGCGKILHTRYELRRHLSQFCKGKTNKKRNQKQAK